ncbi:MAG TPA: histidine kinase dimerization/phospho-acceptor domain-containing protein, partial [Ohtaekwangia sp.]
MLFFDQDLSPRLISEDSIRQHLPSIFQDSLIVDLKFDIIVASQNVLDFLEFTNDELVKKNINYLAGKENLAEFLGRVLVPGFFSEEVVTLYTKSNQPVQISISGFYLGLISDINGRIILKVKNLQELNVVNQKLQQRKAELDKFIYRVAHDIRGPLATIQGLINLLKIREDNSEVDRIIQMMDAHSTKLDERLFQMVYLAEADHEEGIPVYTIQFCTIETALRRVIEQNAFVDFLDFHFQAPDSSFAGANEILVQSLLSNILLYLLSLPKQKLHSQIFFRFTREQRNLKITIGADGFVVDENLRKALHQEASIYTDILNYPRLVNFFAAQKIAWKLDAKILMHFISLEKQRITIT